MVAVITISREFGSGGDEVAARLCEVLLFPHLREREED